MINELRREFEKIYFSNVATTKGLEDLGKNIGISKNSMRRFLGKLNDGTTLRPSTLSLIAKRLGYKDYSDFCDSHGREKYTLDFNLLDIYYGMIKGQPPTVSENRFQKANYYFAEKIISDPDNLKEFMKRFMDNEEALEYVLAWHPSYGNIAQKNYQDALAAFVKITTKAHIKVSMQAFIYFGKFISENLSVEESAMLLAQLEKAVRKMRLQNQTFHAFPEARYTVARCIHHKLQNGTREIPSELLREITMQHADKTTFKDRFIYRTFVSNILNVLNDCETADLCLGDRIPDRQIQVFETKNPAHKANIFLYRVNLAITLHHLDRRDEAMKIFDVLTDHLNVSGMFSFDSKVYFELNYLHLAKILYPERQHFQQRFTILADCMNFQYFKKI